jgi:hypothetical protein
MRGQFFGICRYIDEGEVERYGAFPDWEPLAEDSAKKLKGGQRNVCTVYGVPVLLWLKFVPGWSAISASTGS